MNTSKKKLTILHIVLSIGETNAAYNEHCLPLIDERDIAICTFFRSVITPPARIQLFDGDGTIKGFFRSLRAALDVKKYDIIHIHTPHLGILFMLATQFSYRPFAASAIITVHDSYQNYKLRNRLMFIPIFASFQKIICCSHASFNSFPIFYKVLAGDRFYTVQNGLDIARVDGIAAKIRNNLLDKKTCNFQVVAISRLVDIKNPFSVLKAFQQNQDENSHLIYIGDGPLRNVLAEKCKDSGLNGRIKFTGLIQRDQVFEYLLQADLFLSASRGEGLPVSVLEAMACGCPVLLSDIPSHREIAESVDFIPLVKPDDVVGFAQEIKRFKEMPASERISIGQKCRELVVKRFSLDAMHDGYKKIYSEVMG